MLQEVCHSKDSSNLVLGEDFRRPGVAKKADLQVKWGKYSRIICEHKGDDASPDDIAMDKVKLGQMARDQVRPATRGGGRTDAPPPHSSVPTRPTW
mgnify:CR=1 FL=1